MKRGVLMYAHDNEVIDYGTLALCAGILIKLHMDDIPVVVVSDEPTVTALREKYSIRTIERAIDEFIIVDSIEGVQNFRRYAAGNGSIRSAQYKNINRLTAFELTPFEETLLVDSDFLMLDSSMSKVWGCRAPMMMNKRALSTGEYTEKVEYKRIDPLGIRMYWATAVYFQKTAETKLFFDTVKHIKANYHFYSNLYRFDTVRYRNDYTFSIAAHLMNGEVDEENFVTDLPVGEILNCYEPGGMTQYLDCNNIIIRTHRDGQEIAQRITTNVHVMNKISILRCADSIIEPYNG